MAAAGSALTTARVAVVYLVHGTFVGADALGLLTALARLSPALAEPLKRAQKRLADGLIGECGNYTQQYAELLECGLAGGAAPAIPVRRFLWSSENHHIARADAAMRLLDDLAALRLAPGQRALLWGHSHAGNVFAILTHLLAGDEPWRRAFFDACRSYYRPLFGGATDAPTWERVERRLAAGDDPWRDRPVDVATFGAPVRYAWRERGCDRLLHFVNHRPAEDLAEHQAPFPPSPDAVLQGTLGDVVQHLGIAGTNFAPNILEWRTWNADRRLGRLLESGLAREPVWQRWRRGVRVHEVGRTLLVDYGAPSGPITRHLAGHAVYTFSEWMLFHVEQIVANLYAPAEGKPA